MWGLLSWLWERANRVYTFFGWLYDRIVNAALNAYNWAANKAAEVYWRLIDEIRRLSNSAVGWVNRLRIDTWDWIVDTWGRTTSQINAALGDAWRWAQDTWIRARDYANSISQYAIDFARDLFTDAWEGLKALVNGVAAVADALFVRAVQEAVGLFQKVQAELAEVKQSIGIDTPEEEATLRAWVTDPIGTLAAYLKTIFMSMLEFSVAYAMGTKKYTLPPWPDILEGGRGVPIPRPDPPPPGASGLVPPLSSIYISGHTYSSIHRAVDLGLTRGDTVFAMHDARVAVAGWKSGGYGNKVDLQGDEWWTRYAHLDSFLVRTGDQVRAGDPIGVGGSSGNSSGPHLHLEIKYRGNYIDPVTVL